MASPFHQPNTHFLEKGPAQASLALATGGGICAAIYYLTGDTRAMMIVAFGMAMVLGLVTLYRWVLKVARARRAGPMERGIADNAAMAPNRISEPARRAKLDDLRKSFTSGVEKFRSAGKNLYSYPWYVFVGEPGSGKTEAIRRSGVGFPPGLQDQLQGAGGTINMNWWFTNHAIILDTAGRLMFEEVTPGSTNEWQEFLKLLRDNRPLCPINGMMLMIPADTLQTDTQDEIQRKAGKIAEQLASIQRALGVRFPIFVIITKCDLINGFNEFFNNVDDPNAQSQIVGWSNPNDLDAPFKVEMVDQHLQSVRDRLLRHRMRLLLDPVNTEDANARRLDQVDSLYNLPDGLMRIGPRLKLYLETIFVPQGGWASNKPLFLRGIYFTCAMQRGAALDMDLAAALGVPVSQLPQGPVWQRDRAYFLRDLFLKKVFVEKGLVTRAGNTRKQQRRRKWAVILTSLAAAVAVGLFTWLGAEQLRNDVGKFSYYYVGLKDQEQKFQGSMALLARKGDYWHRQDEEVKIGTKTERAHEVRAMGEELADKPIQVHAIFRPWVGIIGVDLNKDRREVAVASFLRDVLGPAVAAARAKLSAQGNPAPGQANLGPAEAQAAADALVQLIQLEVVNFEAGDKPRAGYPATRKPNLDPLFRYALLNDKDRDEAQYKAYLAEDKPSVVRSLERLFSGSSASTWPPVALAVGSEDSKTAIRRGIEALLKANNDQLTRSNEVLAAIEQADLALNDFRNAIKNGLRFDDARDATRLPAEREEYRKATAPRLEAVALLHYYKALLDQRMGKLRDLKLDTSRPLAELYRDKVRELAGSATGSYDRIAAVIPEQAVRDRAREGKLAGSAGILNDALDLLSREGKQAAAKFEAEASGAVGGDAWAGLEIFTQRAKGVDGQDQPVYAILVDVCGRVSGQMPQQRPGEALAQLAALASASPAPERGRLLDKAHDAAEAVAKLPEEWNAFADARGPSGGSLESEPSTAAPAPAGGAGAATVTLAAADRALADRQAQMMAWVGVLNRIESSRRDPAATGPSGGVDHVRAVADAADFLRKCATRAQRFYAYRQLVRQSPRDLDAWEKAVRAAHNALPADGKARADAVAVTLTTSAETPDPVFAPHYSPDAAGDLAADLRQLGTAVGDATEEKLALNRADLVADHRKAADVMQAYLDAYARYWSGEALRLTVVSKNTLGDYLSALRLKNDDDLNDQLKALGRKAVYALARVSDERATAKARELDAVCEARKEPAYVNRTRALLEHWKGLTDKETGEARKRILNQKAPDLLEGFFLPDADANFMRRYWSDLSLAMLKGLANDAQSLFARNIARLADYRKFPLAKPTPDRPDDELSKAKVAEARELVGQLSNGREPAAAGREAPAGGREEWLVDGANTGKTEIDEQLAILRGSKLPPGSDQVLRAFQARLRSLPGPDEPPIQCKISMYCNASSTISDVYQYAAIQKVLFAQGFNNSPAAIKAVAANLLAGADKPEELTTANLPSDPLLLVLLDAAGKINTLQLPDGRYAGPWAALRLLYAGESTPVSSFGDKTNYKVWKVELPINDIINGRAVVKKAVFQLEFDRNMGGFSDAAK